MGLGPRIESELRAPLKQMLTLSSASILLDGSAWAEFAHENKAFVMYFCTCLEPPTSAVSMEKHRAFRGNDYMVAFLLQVSMQVFR